MEPTKPPAPWSHVMGRFSRSLPRFAPATVAGAETRLTPHAVPRRKSSLYSFLLPSSCAPLRDDPEPDLETWQSGSETVTAPMLIAKATAADLDAVLGLIKEASDWLGRKKTDQWEKPWPTREERDARVLAGLKNEKTWIVWDGDQAAATVTIAAKANRAVWSKPGCECKLEEKAVYAHRLITARKYAGSGLGAELIDWAGLRGRRKNRARWIRIDVWSSNVALHNYYLNSGFKRCGSCDDPDYPSDALFQKPVSVISKPVRPQFTESPSLVKPAANRELVGAMAAAE